MKHTLILSILAIFVVALWCVNIFLGAVSIPAEDVWNAIRGNLAEDDITCYIVHENRIPQATTALLAGAALAVTGLMLQTAFRNPLAGPSILGISSGASLGVAIVMLFLGGSISVAGSSVGGYSAIILGAIIGAFVITSILTAVSLKVKNTLMLLIVGIMTGYLTSSIVTLLSSLSTAQSLQGYVFWGMGTFGSVSSQQIPWVSTLIIVSLFLSMLLAKPLNLLLLGDNYALNLGVNVNRVRTYLLLITGLLTAIVTAFCGPIAFIGLAMPHIARMLMRSDNHWILIPATMLCGASVALACNVISIIPSGNSIPINALTPIVGVPVILYVILSPSSQR